MKSDEEEKSLTPEHTPQEFIPVKEWQDAEGRFQKEKFGKQIWRIIALVILCACLYNTEHKIVWVPDPNDRQMRVDVTDWWGMQKRSFYPVWKKPTGEESKDSERWCIKYPDGTWQVFLADDGDSVYYSWPLKNYPSTPNK